MVAINHFGNKAWYLQLLKHILLTLLLCDNFIELIALLVFASWLFNLNLTLLFVYFEKVREMAFLDFIF